MAKDTAPYTSQTTLRTPAPKRTNELPELPANIDLPTNQERALFFFYYLYLISIVDQTQAGTYRRENFLYRSRASPLFWEVALIILAGAVSLPLEL